MCDFKKETSTDSRQVFLMYATVIPLCPKVFYLARYKWQLSNLINVLRLHLFAKIEQNQLINRPFGKSSHWEPENIQLSLFT
jgi:hypothetical protein